MKLKIIIVALALFGLSPAVRGQVFPSKPIDLVASAMGRERSLPKSGSITTAPRSSASRRASPIVASSRGKRSGC